MNIGEIIQNIATGGAAILGVIYILGGLIVNLNLTRRGIVEYQVLKIKYLAVGMIFMFQFFGVVLFTLIPIMIFLGFLYSRDAAQLISKFASILSILAALTLLLVWSRYPPNTRSVVGRWRFWFAVSVVALLHPLFVLVHQLITPNTDLTWMAASLLAALIGTLSILAMVYHYSSFYYGRPSFSGALDPIGIGIPTRVNLLCDKSLSPALREMGLTIQKNIVQDVYLIDETNDQYIISEEQVPSGTGHNRSYKISKNLVKVILHTPDHMRKLKDNVGVKN